MTHQVYIRTAAVFNGSGKDNACLKRHLKTQYHLDARRFSRLTLLTLAGSLQLSQQQLPKDTAVYWGGTFSSPSVFNEMMGNVFQQQIAKPFDFLANLHNAPAFHTAAALGLNGVTIFQSVGIEPESWGKPLLLAANHVRQNGGSALAGWSHEAEEGNGEREGCCCVYLSSESSTDDEPQIIIRHAEQGTAAWRPACSGLMDAVSEWFDCLAEKNNRIRIAVGGNIVLELQSFGGLKLLASTEL
ncbi:hypothetical protein [Neisseria wadsworthii]|nr:hypothetical protein [Neisseria wadsworthii]QMT35552.1 hypothetical protein H3L96_11055 [Neisseria wadsworthii]